jgi:predicted nucleotidyltransferase
MKRNYSAQIDSPRIKSQYLRMDELQIPIDTKEAAMRARESGIQEFALFGSEVGGDFREDSDIDALVEFAPDVLYSLPDIVELQHRFGKLCQRPVDEVDQRAFRDPFRRRRILETAKVIYAA